MPSVEVRSSCVVSRLDFEVGTPMKDAVASALDSVGQGLKPRSVCFKSNGEVIRDWDITVRQLGQDIVVEVINCEPLSQCVERLQQQLNQQAAEIANLYELHAKAQLPKLYNVSSQVLLVASGEPFRESKYKRFQRRGASDSSIRTVAASLKVSPQEFITAADGIVTRRYKAIRPSDVEELDEVVEETAGLITPALERMAKWECMIIKNYAAIKAAFKPSFGA